MPVTPSEVNEIQQWMPNGAQGEDNLPTLQEYIASVVRRDGALYGSLADCRTYNKVLEQLSKIAVGIALYINQQGIDVKDEDTPEQLRDKVITALQRQIDSSEQASLGSLDFFIDENGNLIMRHTE